VTLQREGDQTIGLDHLCRPSRLRHPVLGSPILAGPILATPVSLKKVWKPFIY
jgi:hypothetical protein